jgi:hypothetical protein
VSYRTDDGNTVLSLNGANSPAMHLLNLRAGFTPGPDKQLQLASVQLQELLFEQISADNFNYYGLTTKKNEKSNQIETSTS